MKQKFDVSAVRKQFPALDLKDGLISRVYFDNPAGTQVPQQVIERTVNCLIHAKMIYARFAELLASGKSDADVRPLQLVCDCFMLGRPKVVEAFL